MIVHCPAPPWVFL